MISNDPDNDFVTHHTNDEKSRNFRKRVLKSDRYKKTVKKMLPYFDAVGLLN
jgi:ribosomal protein L35